jgi:hypothetical protein
MQFWGDGIKTNEDMSILAYLACSSVVFDIQSVVLQIVDASFGDLSILLDLS